MENKILDENFLGNKRHNPTSIDKISKTQLSGKQPVLDVDQLHAEVDPLSEVDISIQAKNLSNSLTGS